MSQAYNMVLQKLSFQDKVMICLMQIWVCFRWSQVMSSLRFALYLTGQLFHLSLQFVEPNTYVLMCDREGFNVGAECKFCVGPEMTGGTV